MLAYDSALRFPRCKVNFFHLNAVSLEKLGVVDRAVFLHLSQSILRKHKYRRGGGNVTKTIVDDPMQRASAFLFPGTAPERFFMCMGSVVQL